MKLKFITFEGSEGCGKTTQIQLLAEYLSQHRQTVICLREPGGTALGETIRHLLKHDPSGHDMCAESELLLFAASRAELVRKVIQPALQANQWVLCDRFHDSTTIYQGIARGLDLPAVNAINHFAIDGLCPSLTLFLDLPAVEARRRMLRRPRPVGKMDRMENESPEFYEKVIAGFHQLAANDSQRVRRIDARGDKKEVFNRILTEFTHAFPGHLD